MIDIPSAKNMRMLSEYNIKAENEVDEILTKLIKRITSESEKGLKSVFVEGSIYYRLKSDSSMRKAFDKLCAAGYLIDKQSRTETEYTCFGTGRVAVEGVLIRW